jgi:stearoyl-CoA desaturase (Delta-9 desaturase)
MGGVRSLPFWGVHVVAIAGVAMTGWSWSGLVLAMALYYGRMFFLTAGYHRYFSHRTFKVSRLVQFLLGLGGTFCLQKGPLWWAGNHRLHHRHADRPGDIHSPRLRGLWWAHVGWIVSRDHTETEWAAVPDLARFPELRWLERHWLVAPLVMAGVLWLAGGWWALLWGGFASTTLLWHGTFTINSLAHVFGRRRYPTGDDSRNSLGLALLTMGEGWHNNHHRYPGAERQGFFWWEVDVTHYVLTGLAWLGVVSELRGVPAVLLRAKPGVVQAQHTRDR